jgi:hypothetical protein
MSLVVTRRTRIVVALAVLGSTLIAAPALAATAAPAPAAPAGHAAHLAAGDPHHPFGEDLLKVCADEMNRSAFRIDQVLPSTTSSTMVSTRSDRSRSTCWNFGWSEVTVPATEFTVYPQFSGPDINFSLWDCNHSSMLYGIYGQASNGAWVYLRGGLGYGNLANNSCYHDVANFPAQTWGANFQTQWGGGKFRIGTQVWSHDDPNFGHPHNLCADPVNCWWNSRLLVIVQ